VCKNGAVPGAVLGLRLAGQRAAVTGSTAFAERSSHRPLTAARPMSYVLGTVFDNDEYRSRATTLAETADSARGLPASGPEGDH
jgi:hypothetical protein